MREIILAGLLTISFFAHGETDERVTKKNIEVPCTDAAATFSIIREEYFERAMVILVDESQNRSITLLVNPENKSWTLIELIDKKACVIATGVGVFNPSSIKKSKTQKNL